MTAIHVFLSHAVPSIWFWTTALFADALNVATSVGALGESDLFAHPEPWAKEASHECMMDCVGRETSADCGARSRRSV